MASKPPGTRREAWERHPPSPLSLRSSPPADAWSQTANHQTWEAAHFCGFNPFAPSGLALVTVPAVDPEQPQLPMGVPQPQPVSLQSPFAETLSSALQARHPDSTPESPPNAQMIPELPSAQLGEEVFRGCPQNQICDFQRARSSWIQFSSVQSLSPVRLFATPWTAAHQASLSITNSRSLLKLMSIKSVMPSNHLILCRPLLLPPSIFPSIRVFSNESVLHIWWPKYWDFNFNISPSNEYSGLISFRMDWLDLLEVQGTLKSLLQHHSSKASILRRSAFFMVQLSHPYVTTGKTRALTRRTFVGKALGLKHLKSAKLCNYSYIIHPRSLGISAT